MDIFWAMSIGFLVGLLVPMIFNSWNRTEFIVGPLYGILGALFAIVGGQRAELFLRGERDGYIAAAIGALLMVYVAREIKPVLRLLERARHKH